MDKKTKKISKRDKDDDEHKAEEQPKMLYNRKFTVPLRKKRKNMYDADEEARLEKIVFGDPSDILSNLDDKSKTKVKDESIIFETIADDSKDDENDSVDSEVESDQDVSISNHSDDTRPKERKAAWIDEDDYNYT